MVKRLIVVINKRMLSDANSHFIDTIWRSQRTFYVSGMFNLFGQNSSCIVNWFWPSWRIQVCNLLIGVTLLGSPFIELWIHKLDWKCLPLRMSPWYCITPTKVKALVRGVETEKHEQSTHLSYLPHVDASYSTSLWILVYTEHSLKMNMRKNGWVKGNVIFCFLLRLLLEIKKEEKNEKAKMFCGGSCTRMDGRLRKNSSNGNSSLLCLCHLTF